MAKLKRYELYEGDGEIIPDGEWNNEPRSRRGGDAGDGDLPPEETEKPGAGTAAGGETRRRYFLSREEEDGLGPALPLFDDFERYSPKPDSRKGVLPPPRKPKQGGWIAVSVVCVLLLAGMGLLALPMLTGHKYEALPLPSIGFVNKSMIVSDAEREKLLEARRDELFSGRIYQGIYIDNVHMDGRTKAEAVQAVENANVKTDTTFDIIVAVGNMSWHVNSERVPVSRNTQETVDKAWAAGRSNTYGVRWGSDVPPFEERVDQVNRLRSYPLTFTTVQDYDHEALRTMAEGIANYVHREPVNSTVESFNFATKTFTFTEDQPGANLDAEALYNKLTNLLDNHVTQTTLQVTPEKILAPMTKTELMNRFGLISAYTTTTTKNNNRNTNIKLSAAAINGITVMPGETFSFNQTVGERTAAKGYKEAAAISGGQTRDEIGGGVCQTSSTLFNAVARANLEIVERSPHAWPSNYVEKGFDATVNWPDLDFKFKNNTEWPVFILAGYENRKVTVNIYGMSLGADVKIDLESIVTKHFPKPEGVNYVVNTKLAPGESKKTVTAREGYEVQTWKVWYQGKTEIRRELLFTTTYKSYQETVEYNPQ